ncbi:MAG: GAF domain-containing sensor histidine kinase [Chloroflexales bacterium]|nr:GAF domain-containing sensor histidine kinase [Chloroflexales bacterium]
MATALSEQINPPEAEAALLRQRVALLEQQTRELTALHAVASAASQVSDLDELLSQALDAVLEAAPIPELRPMGGVFLVDHATGQMSLAALRGLHPDFVAQERCVRLGECLCGLVGQSGQPRVSRNSASDPQHQGHCTRGEAYGQIVAPLLARGRTVGVLFLFLRPDFPPDPAYVELATVIGQQLGVAVEEAQLYRQLQATVTQLQTTGTKLSEQNARLERTNSELRVAYELALAMQSSADLTDVQERLLSLITAELGYERALLAMADHHELVLSGWICSTSGPGGHLQRIPHTTRLLLELSSGPLIEAMRTGQPVAVNDGRPPTSDPQINSWLGLGSYMVLPMVLRQQPLGVLVIDNPHSGRAMNDADLALLSNINQQASVVLGGVQLCIDRAQRLAVEDERSRIAMEVHDSISQQLYGLTYSIDACVELLPEHADEVREQLIQLLPQAQQANAALRRAIFDLWPDELDHERFVAELRGYLESIAPGRAMQVHQQVDRGFDDLPTVVRKQFYRIAQEALNNVVKHALARRVKLTLVVSAQAARMRIADDGCGFDPREGAAAQTEGKHFGLTSMRERAEALGGQIQLDSALGQGTIITVTLPLNC